MPDKVMQAVTQKRIGIQGLEPESLTLPISDSYGFAMGDTGQTPFGPRTV